MATESEYYQGRPIVQYWDTQLAIGNAPSEDHEVNPSFAVVGEMSDEWWHCMIQVMNDFEDDREARSSK